MTNKRIPNECQWPNILQKKLGNGYKVYQEGLPARVAGEEEKDKLYKCGKLVFMSSFKVYSPVDIIIISLGTNDLQIKYKQTCKQVYSSLLWYKKVLEDEYKDIDNKQKYFNNNFPKIIYILPPNFDYQQRASHLFNEASERKRNNIYKMVE